MGVRGGAPFLFAHVGSAATSSVTDSTPVRLGKRTGDDDPLASLSEAVIRRLCECFQQRDLWTNCSICLSEFPLDGNGFFDRTDARHRALARACVNQAVALGAEFSSPTIFPYGIDPPAEDAMVAVAEPPPCPLEEAPPADQVYSLICALQCGHVYHLLCLRRWLDSNSVCPLCKEASGPLPILWRDLLESPRRQLLQSGVMYAPVMAPVRARQRWYWRDGGDSPVATPYSDAISSQIQQAYETGVNALIVVMVNGAPAFYAVCPRLEYQIKVLVDTEHSRALREAAGGRMVVVDDAGSAHELDGAVQEALTRAREAGQLSACCGLPMLSFEHMHFMRGADFDSRCSGKLYSYHLRLNKQVRYEADKVHGGRLLKVRRISPDPVRVLEMPRAPPPAPPPVAH